MEFKDPRIRQGAVMIDQSAPDGEYWMKVLHSADDMIDIITSKVCKKTNGGTISDEDVKEMCEAATKYNDILHGQD